MAQLLSCLATLGGSSPCLPGQFYAGDDLLAVDATYESLMMSQLQYWSTNSNTKSLAVTKDNIGKGFFNCTGARQLDLVHWCACGIEDMVDTTTGMKSCVRCVVPCSSTSGAKDSGSEAESSSLLLVVTVNTAAAILFAAGLM